MKKQGFTLVELIAIIAILGILVVMVTPGIIAVRKNVLEKTLVTKVSNIENAAKDYAMDNLQLLKTTVTKEINVYKANGNTYYASQGVNGEVYYDLDKFKAENGDDFSKLLDCTWITVNGLINTGYLNGSTSYVNTPDGEKEEQIINPVTGDSMNDNIICIRYDNNNAMTRTIISFMFEEENNED